MHPLSHKGKESNKGTDVTSKIRLIKTYRKFLKDYVYILQNELENINLVGSAQLRLSGMWTKAKEIIKWESRARNKASSEREME